MTLLTKALLATAVSLVATECCHATTINFDDLVGGTSISSPTPVTNQYAGLGVTFSDPSGPMGALLGSVPPFIGYSPPNVLFATQLQSNGNAGDLRLDFSVNIESVSFDAFQSGNTYIEALAYGPGNNLLADIIFPTVASFGVLQHDTVSTTQPISYLLLTSHPAALPNTFFNFALDNVTFSAASVPGPIVGAGLSGMMFVCGGLLAWAIRRKQVA